MQEHHGCPEDWRMKPDEPPRPRHQSVSAARGGTSLVRPLIAANVLVFGLAAILNWPFIVMFAGVGYPERAGEPMLIVAHRGNMQAKPEDTAEAIWDAARLGADGIEFDVHQSADGTWWVIHDPTVDRTTNGTGWVWQMTDADLAALTIDAGPGIRDGLRIGVPRLDVVLAGLEDYRGRLYVDLQHAVVADPGSLAFLLGPFDALVICRSEADVAALSTSMVGSVIRPSRAAPDSASDAFLLESVREATLERLAGASRPVATYTDDHFAFLPEWTTLNRAWAGGVDAYLTKRLTEALQLRDKLAAGAAP